MNLSNIYTISNAYFMAHQPEFMLGMIVLFSTLVIGIALLDGRR